MPKELLFESLTENIYNRTSHIVAVRGTGKNEGKIKYKFRTPGMLYTVLADEDQQKSIEAETSKRNIEIELVSIRNA